MELFANLAEQATLNLETVGRFNVCDGSAAYSNL